VYDLRVNGSMKGPIPEGRADRIVEEYRQDLEKVIARRGAALVVRNLKSRIKNPTPYYWNQIRATPVGGHWEVVDGNVVYGPWLEGTGSRNRARPGFPGYRSFQLAARTLDGLAGTLGEQHLRLYVPRLEGR
jgi:hypothetical protein